MNREILKVIGRECVWYSLVCGISFISATALFLILESFGFDNTLDSPTDIFYGLPPIFFNASLLGSDLALLFIVLLRTDLDSLNIRKWKSERPNLSFFKYLGIGVGAAFLVIGFDSFEIVT